MKKLIRLLQSNLIYLLLLLIILIITFVSRFDTRESILQSIIYITFCIEIILILLFVKSQKLKKTRKGLIFFSLFIILFGIIVSVLYIIELINYPFMKIFINGIVLLIVCFIIPTVNLLYQMLKEKIMKRKKKELIEWIIFIGIVSLFIITMTVMIVQEWKTLLGK